MPEMPPDAPMKRVYGGVRDDWSVLTGPPAEHPHDRTALSALIDMPFSFVGDTLTLPYTLAWEKGVFGMALMHYPPEDDSPAAVMLRQGLPPGDETGINTTLK